MITSVTAGHTSPLKNFSDNTVSKEFFNSHEFVSNELYLLGNYIKQMEEASKRGSQKIKDAINGLT